LSSDNPQQFTIAPSDTSMSFDEAHKVVKSVVATIAGCRIIDVDPRNKIAIVEIPSGEVAALRSALGSGFLVDPNAPLRY